MYQIEGVVQYSLCVYEGVYVFVWEHVCLMYVETIGHLQMPFLSCLFFLDKVPYWHGVHQIV